MMQYVEKRLVALTNEIAGLESAIAVIGERIVSLRAEREELVGILKPKGTDLLHKRVAEMEAQPPPVAKRPPVPQPQDKDVPPCPLCNAPGARNGMHGSKQLLKCTACGHEYVHKPGMFPTSTTKQEKPTNGHKVYPVLCPKCAQSGATAKYVLLGVYTMRCVDCAHEWEARPTDLQTPVEPATADYPPSRKPANQTGRDTGATRRVLAYVKSQSFDALQAGILLVRIQADTGTTAGMVHYAVKKKLLKQRDDLELYQDLTQDRKVLGIRLKAP